MPNYALIRGGIVQGVAVADAPPVVPGITVVPLTDGQPVGPGDTYSGGVFTPYVPNANEQEHSAVLGRLRDALPLLAFWSQDTKSAAELTAMTAAERITRQAQIEQRVATEAQALRALIKQVTDL